VFADRCGLLQEGDRVLAINGWSLKARTMRDVIDMISVSRRHLTLRIEFDVAGSLLVLTVHRRSIHTCHHHHNRFTALFLGPPGWAGARRELLDFMIIIIWCKGRLTEADTLIIRLGATQSGLTSAHLHNPPIHTVPTYIIIYAVPKSWNESDALTQGD